MASKDEDVRLTSARASSVFALISHPVLRSVDPVKVVAFLVERKQYENEIQENRNRSQGYQ
eukprot:IDg8345t1